MTCSTRYPILLLHGAGFRDSERFCYWGRIPKALEERGAAIYYGHQDARGSVEHNAAVVKANLEKILAETGCEKVNIIGHSKGGLEARYMISSLGCAAHVASLTTVATPHRGSETVDLLCRLPKSAFKFAAFFADRFSLLLGDEEPDFYTVGRAFCTENMAAFNERNPDAPGVRYQSYAGVMRGPYSDALVSLPYRIVKRIEGENDGLVTPASAMWGNFRGVLRGAGRRGVSHADEVDMRRVDIPCRLGDETLSDIRQLYIGIAEELKRMGY
jgi:triacylglycerol lipase